VAYDRDEWRTPWRASGTGTGVSDGAAGVADDAAGDTAGVATDGPASGRTEAVDRPREATPVAAVPIARHPQPPPSAWDPTTAGPGSPPGSVRPPDTTGTHDAPPAAAKRGRTLVVAIVGGLVGALAGGGLVGALLMGDDTDAPLVGEGASAPSIEVDGGVESAVPAVAEAVLPSVVSIDVPSNGLEGGGPLGGPDGGGAPAALGSGVIYRADGYILTNDHVVGDAEEVTVRLASGDILEAEVIGNDELNDLAVIRVDISDVASDLPAINLRDDQGSLTVGASVIAMGSPFGLDGSVTTGIVSGLDRDLRVPAEDGPGQVIPAVIQTDAAINPGNSGGALVDGRGRLIGINTAILSRTGGSQGVGFAVPADQAVRSADQIIDQGFVRYPLLGITGVDVSPAIADEFDLEAPRGAIVAGVEPGTGAEEAGVEPDDVIVEVDGEPLATMSQLVSEVRGRTPGDVVELTIVRDGEEIQLDVTLSERPRD
jgi:S1-C subfamily serine protease